MIHSIIKTEPIIKTTPISVTEMGDCPNIEMHVITQISWKDIDRKKGWRLQKNFITGHARILDENNIRKAWGNPIVMKEKFKRLTRDKFLEPGDVIGIARKQALNLYEHYGVYVGGNTVIHYSGDGTELSKKSVIKSDTLDNFLGNDTDLFVLFFDYDLRTPHKIQKRTNFNLSDVNNSYSDNIVYDKNFKIYSPNETIKRAISRIGEEDYNLLINNCEHFAVWCKTGVARSYQINANL